MSCRRCDSPGAPDARELRRTEIHIADRCPRIACMVSFLRAELLPEDDFIREASIFPTA